jgi:hypothetical protein
MGAAGIESLRWLIDQPALRATLLLICGEKTVAREKTPTDPEVPGPTLHLDRSWTATSRE